MHTLAATHDIRKVSLWLGHDGLAALVKNELHTNPFTGTVFAFRSKRADRLKLLYWDGTGLVHTTTNRHCLGLGFLATDN